MGKWLVFTTVISLITSVSPAWAGGDVASGKVKSAACAGCHGADGNSVNPDWPKLAGQGENYLDKQLQDFKSGARKNATMAPMVAALTGQDMADLSAFFSSQTRQVGSADEKLVELGQKIYRGGNPASGVSACSGCHSPNGAGNPAASFPALSGQHAKYVETQLNAFKSGERSNDPGKMMRAIADRMTEKEIKAVASYMQGLH
ncbi:MAG TPA: cytochrome c4 [Gammaproteobacteria bacterium]|nr:cytochrome c4 [Gammaproteobacteria bacterium]